MISLKKFEMKSDAQIMAQRNFPAAQKFVDSEVLRLSDKYVPMDKGTLKGSGTRHTRIGAGEVVYRTPYAKRLYYNPQYNFQGAPTRGGYWFERMKNDSKAQILKGAARITGGKL